MKLSEAVELYIATVGTLRTDQSRLGMRKVARQLVDYCGDLRLDNYTVEDLTGFCLGHGGRGSAPNTVAYRLGLIRPFFDWAEWQGHVRKSLTPALKHTVKAGHGGVRAHTWLSETQVLEALHSFNLEDPRQHRDLVVFRTTLMLGLRRSETASLRWPMFKRDLSTVTFVGKGAKLATLPLPATLQTELARWRDVEPEGAVPFPSFHSAFDDDGNHIVEAQWTRPIGANGVYYIIKEIADKLGVPSLAPHDLRRTFAGLIEEKGVGLRDLQQLMRHSQLATTDRYMKSDPGRLAKIVRGVEWET
jgi:site-specific recombinase XerD